MISNIIFTATSLSLEEAVFGRQGFPKAFQLAVRGNIGPRHISLIHWRVDNTLSEGAPTAKN